MLLLRASVAVFSLVLAVTVVASASAASWSAPVVVAPLSTSVTPALAVSPDGRAVAAWALGTSTDRSVMTAERPAGGAWSAPQQVGLRVRSTSSIVPTVAATDDDTALAWRGDGGWQLASAAAGAPFGMPAPSVAQPGQPRLASSSDGWTIAAWDVPPSDAHPGGFMVMERPPGGTFEPPVFVEAPVTRGPVTVAISSGGQAVAAWTGSGAAGPVAVVSRAGGSGAWSTPSVLGTGVGVQAAAVGLTPSGEAVVAWGDTATRVMVAQRRDGAWSAERQVGIGQPAWLQLRLAIDAAGDTVLGWNDFGVPRFARRPAGGAFGAPFSAPGTCTPPLPGLVGLHLDGDGNAIALWAGFAHPTSAPLDAAVLAANGTVHPLEPLIESTGLSGLTTAIDGAGIVTALWAHRGTGDVSLDTASTTAPLRDLVAQTPAVAAVDCPPVAGSRPPTAASLPAATAPALRFAATRPLALTRGRLRVPVRCPKAARGTCAGTLTARAAGRQVASARFSLRPGSVRTLTVRVTAKRRPRSVQLRATTASAGAAPVVTRATFAVRRAR